MFRTASRHSTRIARVVWPTAPFPSSRRTLGTASASKKGTWRGTAVRWGLAVGAVYWYNTSPIFADEPPPQTIPPPPHFADSDLPTVNAVVEEKRKLAEERARHTTPEPPAVTNPGDKQAVVVPQDGQAQSPEELQEEAGQQGAFDPETGEINWDCPCLGGMAHGPCGEEFKAAFSCFVYSTEEVKGMDCIDKFQHMQDCFRKYPEVYGAELEDDEGEEATPSLEGAEGEALAPKSQENVSTPTQATAVPPKDSSSLPSAKGPSAPDSTVDAEKVVTPKIAVDATEANKETK